eukprot:TRINITY_DN462_c0_g1_i1.p5 TRINITY_DN462_c0_g1~~TRINITY_DN462_c0_g1_i1.p5  ORF type:complete len:201 (-),score=22.36 TRINITY_DN462_c0_g1_i1:1882-2484(-)
MLKESEDGSLPPVSRLALFMHMMFKHVDLTPTDMLLSLILVAVQQRTQRKQHALKVIHEYEQQISQDQPNGVPSASVQYIQEQQRQQEIELSEIVSKDKGQQTNQNKVILEKQSGEQLIDVLHELSHHVPTSEQTSAQPIFLTPSAMYKQERPDVDPVLAADLFSNQPIYVDLDTLKIAQHYCKFTMAIYVYGERKKAYH